MHSVGRRLFGVATLATGVITLIWHNYSGPHVVAYAVYAAAVTQVLGGVAIVPRRSATIGAAILAAAYLVFALLCVPKIVAAPGNYIPWGDFFEQFSLFTGAVIAYAWLSSSLPSSTIARGGRICLGICVVSFALEQAFYLQATAALVPTWLPPSQLFWAIATTVAFALAAAALLTNRAALLGTRLLTAMVVGFGLLVWVPLLLSNPHSQTNWSEGAETFAIAGAAWILANCLDSTQARRHSL